MCKLYLQDLEQLRFGNLKEDIMKNTLPSKVGMDTTHNIKIQDDLYFLKTNYKFYQETQIESKQAGKSFVIALALKGNSTYENLDKEKVKFKQGYTTISSFNKTEGFRHYEDKDVQHVRLILKEEFLKRNLTNELLEKYFINSQNNINLINFSPTMIQSELILKDILNCHFIGDLKNLYVQSKILELLSLEVNKISQEDKQIILDDYDKEAIYKAKEILIKNMQNPPSIIELSKQVHLNEFKLKKGFKQVFNTSPYKLLLKYKMNEAKILIEKGEYNINEISELVGYKFTSSFTNAFFKECGILPKDLMKKRKFYY